MVHEYGGDTVAKDFEDMLSELYNLESGCKLKGLSEQEIRIECQGKYTECIVQRIRKRLNEELRKDNEF